MKHFKLSVLILLVAVSATACIIKIPEVSKPEEDVSDSVSEPASEVSANENSYTEVSDVVDLSALTARELFEYAEKLTEEYVNYTCDMDMDMLTTVQGQQTSYSSTYKAKIKDAGSEDEKVSVAITNTSEGTDLMMYYYKNVGYYSDGASRLSFSCNSEQFSEIAMFIRDGREDSDVNDEYLIENASVSVADNGDLIISLKDVITDEALIREVFAFDDDDQVVIKNMDIDWTFTMDSYGRPKSDIAILKFDMVPQIAGAEDMVASSTVTSSCTYNVNDNINIVIPDVKYTDLGDYTALYVTDCIDVLENIDYYSAVTTIDYDCTANGTTDKLKVNLDMYYDKTGSLKFAMKEKYVVDAQNIVYGSHFENGIYSFNDGTGIKEQEIDELSFDSATLIDSCIPVDFSWAYGEGFAYADSGDGTATLTFNFRQNLVTEFADIFAVTLYGQEYSTFFSGASSVNVKSAAAKITVDTENGMLLEYSFNIEAVFVIENMTVNFKEKTTTTFSTDTFIFPAKGAFFGSSAM